MLKVHVTYIIGLFIACEVVANITAGKITQFGPFTVPAAIYIFALTFTLLDLINETLGKLGARRVVIAGVLANVVLALYSLLALALPSPPWFEHAGSYSVVLGLAPRVVAASLIAALLAGLLDAELFARLRARLAPGWRVLASNALSTLCDSIVFISLAFAGAPGFPPHVLLQLMAGQYVVKLLVTLASVPLIYLVRGTVSVDHSAA